MIKKQCKATTQNGKRCENQTEGDYCHVHAYLGNKKYMKSLNEPYIPKSHTTVLIREEDLDTILPILGLILLLGGSYLFFGKDNWMGIILGFIGLFLTAVNDEIDIAFLFGFILLIGGLYQFIFQDNGIGFILAFIGFVITTATFNQTEKNK